MKDKFKGKKTFLFAALVFLAGGLEATPWVDIIPATAEPYILPAVGVITAYLRKITTGPV